MATVLQNGKEHSYVITFNGEDGRLGRILRKRLFAARASNGHVTGIFRFNQEESKGQRGHYQYRIDGTYLPQDKLECIIAEDDELLGRFTIRQVEPEQKQAELPPNDIVTNPHYIRLYQEYTDLEQALQDTVTQLDSQRELLTELQRKGSDGIAALEMLCENVGIAVPKDQENKLEYMHEAIQVYMEKQRTDIETLLKNEDIIRGETMRVLEANRRLATEVTTARILADGNAQNLQAEQEKYAAERKAYDKRIEVLTLQRDGLERTMQHIADSIDQIVTLPGANAADRLRNAPMHIQEHLRQHEEQHRSTEAALEERLNDVSQTKSLRGISTEELLAEAICRSYAPRFARAASLYDAAYPEGVPAERNISLTPVLEYVLGNIGADRIGALGINIDELRDTNQLRDELGKRIAPYQNTLDENERIQLTWAESHVTMKASLRVKQGQDSAYDAARSFIKTHEQREQDWLKQANLARQYLDQAEELELTHMEATQLSADQPLLQGLRVGCYAYSVAEQDKQDYRLTFLVPTTEENATSGLAATVITALAQATRHMGEDIAVSTVRNIGRVDVKYSAATMPDPARAQAAIDYVRSEVEKTPLSRLGIAMDITYFNRMENL